MSLNWLGTFATFVSLDLKDFYLSKGKCDQIAQAHRYALEQALSSSHGPIYVALSVRSLSGCCVSVLKCVSDMYACLLNFFVMCHDWTDIPTTSRADSAVV